MTPSEQSYREIPLTQGQVALVDKHRFDELSQYRWYARWCKNVRSFYAVRHTRINGRDVVIYMHREVLRLADSKVTADHINHFTLDNRENNLRPATYSENQRNRSMDARNKTGFRGVIWHRRAGKYMAGIRANKKSVYLGLFIDPVNAAKAYDQAARELFGPFAVLNFP